MPSERVSVSDAAKLLGVTPDAVRQRIRRGTIEYEKTEDGRYYVYLTEDDTLGDGVQEPYINALKSQIELLERELEDRKEEARRYQHLLAAALERIPPQLEEPRQPPREEPSEPRESPVADHEEEGRGETPPDTERRSWWRRLFEG